ncbi:hypothetical protein B0H14DRAFT_1387084 [Mycena olivaceomarginata]|nr:hypothetical protein B0H14DRAFT_1387084 [Mycena olivaceomarginata]
MGAHINPAGWEPWSTAEPNTSGVLFAEFGSTGPGAAGTRASFSKKLTSAAGFGIADVLGANWATGLTLRISPEKISLFLGFQTIGGN